MNYVKSCLIITMLLGVGYSQSVHLEIQNVNLADVTGDGQINVLDLVQISNYILNP